MKKQLFLFLLTFVLLISCVTSNNGGTMDFSYVAGKEWNLTAVFIDGNDTQFKRGTQSNDMTRGFFTLNLQEGVISGTGAPNRYSGRYTLGDDRSFSTSPLISTMMAPLFEPEGLREHTYFFYLQNAFMWRLVNNDTVLELHSISDDGSSVILVYQSN